MFFNADAMLANQGVDATPNANYFIGETTTGDRTVFVPFEDRRVYVERQTTSAERTVRVAA